MNDYTEDKLVQKTTAEFMEQHLGWESVYAYNTEMLGESGTLGRGHEGEVVLARHLRQKLEELNPGHPGEAYQEALDQLTATSASKNLLHANRAMYALIRDGVRVSYKAADGTKRSPRLKVIDFDEPENNFHHNAVCMLSNGVEARVGTLVSSFDYFHQWKRIEEDEPGVVEWETMLRALCDKRRFLDLVENFILFDDSPSGGTIKAMLVTIDKITAVRMHDLITAGWSQEIARQQGRLAALEKADTVALETKLVGEDEDTRVHVLAVHQSRVDAAKKKLDWLQATEVCVVISEEQNEVKKFKDWGLNIVPHRTRMKQRDLAEEFKKDDHPFRVVIVCAMWLTGFDVPSLATLYLDKPMKGHTLMQAIARANRKPKGKNNGHLVDYNGMLKSLRAALAKYGEGDKGGSGTGGENPPAEGLDELLAAFVDTIAQCEEHLQECGFALSQLVEAEGFEKLALLSKDNEDSAVNAVCQSDEARARFEVLAREIFKKRKALVSEPELTKPYSRKADAIDAIYKRLQDNKDAADISAVMMALRGVVSEAITHQPIIRLPGADSGKVYDISRIDFDKLRQEFEKQPHKNTTVQSIKDAVEKKLKRMLQRNPLRMDFYECYRKIIDEYNKETDRATIEKTFEQLVKFVNELSEEDQRAVKEGLDEEQLPVFDLLVRTKGELATKERNRVKEVASELIESIKAELAKLDHWKEKRQTQAQVQQLIYNHLYDEKTGLPVDAYSDDEVKALAEVVYLHVYQQYESATENAYASSRISDLRGGQRQGWCRGGVCRRERVAQPEDDGAALRRGDADHQLPPEKGVFGQRA